MIQYRKYIMVECKTCGKELKVRTDYIKAHKGYCNSCFMLAKWGNEEYRNKNSESHKGQKPSCMLPKGEASFNNLYYSYTKSAQVRGIQFSLTKEEFKAITSNDCYYCGVEPKQAFNSSNKNKFNGDYLYNGVDRKDDELGYILDNCVAACKKCNYAKQGLTDIEFLEHIKKIYKKHYEVDGFGSSQITTK